MDEPVLQIRDLCVTFNTPLGPLHAVRGVDLDVHASEMVAVVGESGSGKSVSFLAAMGLLPRTATVSGSVMLQGRELVGASAKDLRAVRGHLLSMIFQDPLSALNPVHRIGAQIAEMLQAHQKLSDKAARARAVDLLDIVGIPQPGDRALQYPHEFSGGMRQRVVIAMAIANSPKVLIADEPTTALDVTVQAQILDLIRKMQRELGMAVVFITHDLGVIARIADRVQVMYAGRSVEVARVGDLFAGPRHPYTAGLLASIPAPDGGRVEPIPGAAPSMVQPPPGCAFHPRCAQAEAICRSEQPVLQPVLGVRRSFACHRPLEAVEGSA